MALINIWNKCVPVKGDVAIQSGYNLVQIIQEKGLGNEHFL